MRKGNLLHGRITAEITLESRKIDKPPLFLHLLLWCNLKHQLKLQNLSFIFLKYFETQILEQHGIKNKVMENDIVLLRNLCNRQK